MSFISLTEIPAVQSDDPWPSGTLQPGLEAAHRIMCAYYSIASMIHVIITIRPNAFAVSVQDLLWSFWFQREILRCGFSRKHVVFAIALSCVRMPSARMFICHYAPKNLGKVVISLSPYLDAWWTLCHNPDVRGMSRVN